MLLVWQFSHAPTLIMKYGKDGWEDDNMQNLPVHIPAFKKVMALSCTIVFIFVT